MNVLSKIALCTIVAASISGCSDADQVQTPIQAGDRAQQLAQQYMIIDTHIDVPYRLRDDWEDVSQATARGEFDYPRAVAGGLNIPFMSIYIPAHLERTPKASYQLAHELIDGMEALAYRAPEKFTIVSSSAEAERAFSEGKIGIALGMENGSPIEGSLDHLKQFYQRGIRYITLAHSESNHISDSSYDLRKQWNGLSPFGKTLIGEMNQLGIMVDISHVSDDAFWQVIELSKTPVIASHSSLRRFTPGFERNMSDEMIKALAAQGGVIMINFGSAFVTQQANRYNEMIRPQIEAIRAELGETAEAEAKIAELRSKNPYPFATLEQVLDHIDYVRDLVGVAAIGIGSDYDGVGDSLPIGLKDVSSYPNLVQGLLDRGYSEDDIGNILSGNLMRVWKANESYAAQFK